MPEKLELRNPVTAAFLGWLVPGLGHIYQGRTAKGVLFAVCIIPLFLFGSYLGDGKIVYLRWTQQEWRWPYLAQVGVGVMALPALAQWAGLQDKLPGQLAEYQAPPDERQLDELHRKYGKRVEIAVIYTIVAGLLNMLAIYDALAGPAMYHEEQKLLDDNEDSHGE